MKFALMQAIFDECFLSEKHIQYIPPFALFFLILPGDGGYHLAHYICAYLLDSCLAPWVQCKLRKGKHFFFVAQGVPKA